MVNSSSAYTGSADNDKIITRDSNGDFGARIADLNQLKVDGDLVLDSSVVSSGGFIQLYAYNEQGGILLQTGSVAQDNVTQYRNNLHQFSTLDGNNDAPISCSQIETLSLTTGGQAVAGSVTGNWSLVGSSKFEATYAADLAEYYEGDSEYEPGTVLVFGGDKEVTKSNIKQDTRVAGVVSDNAAYVMYGACPGLKNLVALQGRVPCKVVGKIKKGDLLTTSGIPGVAGTVSGTPITGTIIGKALQEYDSDHIGTIEVAVGRS